MKQDGNCGSQVVLGSLQIGLEQRGEPGSLKASGKTVTSPLSPW